MVYDVFILFTILLVSRYFSETRFQANRGVHEKHKIKQCTFP